MKLLPFMVLIALVATTLGCSTLGRKGQYPDTLLSNPNPAPNSLMPPNYAGDGSPLMDATYLSSQSDYHFTMGETYSYAGQSSKAIEEFKLTLIYDPKSVHVRLRLAAEYFRMGMTTEAVEQGEIASEMDPKSLEAHMLLGGIYSGLKTFDAARKHFAAVLELEPENTDAAIYMGALLAEERKYDEAVQYFQKLAKNKNFKEPEKAHYYIGRIYAEEGESKFELAIMSFSQALKLKADYPEAAMALAMLHRARNEDEAMAKILNTYQEKFGPQREMARQLGQFYLEKEDYLKALEQLEYLDGFERDNLNVKIQISLILIEQKKYEAAAQRLEDVLRLAPDSDKVRYYLGAVYEELGKPSLAIENYKEIPSASSYYAEAAVHTAHLQKTTGRLDRALATVQTAIKQADDNPSLYAYYATLLDESKDYKYAVKMLHSALDKFPDNTQLRFFLGTMYDRVGNQDETVKQMIRVLDLDKDHVQALNYLAYTYAEMGRNLDEALALASRAGDLQPGDGYILDTLGWIHFKKGEMEEAIRLLEMAYKAKSDEAIIAEHLGDAYLRHQMWQKAQKMYHRASELESDNIRNQKIMEKLANLEGQMQKPDRKPAGF
ncbi:MAG: tetratricopeptide repeat protein [Bdellovibrionales bacterium]